MYKMVLLMFFLTKGLTSAIQSKCQHTLCSIIERNVKYGTLNFFVT